MLIKITNDKNEAFLYWHKTDPFDQEEVTRPGQYVV